MQALALTRLDFPTPSHSTPRHAISPGMEAATEEVARLKAALSSGAPPASPEAPAGVAAAAPRRRPGRPRSTASKGAAPVAAPGQ
jgi:hypothetical protein